MDVSIKTIAFILLLGRLVSFTFMVMVVKRQRALSKVPINKELLPLRQTLGRLSVIVLIGNLIPIVIDILTILAPNNLEREDSPSIIGVTYGFSNCITSAISAFLIWTLYKQAEKTVLIVDQAIEDALIKKNGVV